MGHIVFTSVLLPCSGDLGACMCASLIELQFHIVMRHIPVIEYILLGVHGLLQSHPISPGIECYRLVRP
jgi:uncharacterized membrane protein